MADFCLFLQTLLSLFLTSNPILPLFSTYPSQVELHTPVCTIQGSGLGCDFHLFCTCRLPLVWARIFNPLNVYPPDQGSIVKGKSIVVVLFLQPLEGCSHSFVHQLFIRVFFITRRFGGGDLNLVLAILFRLATNLITATLRIRKRNHKRELSTRVISTHFKSNSFYTYFRTDYLLRPP